GVKRGRAGPVPLPIRRGLGVGRSRRGGDVLDSLAENSDESPVRKRLGERKERYSLEDTVEDVPCERIPPNGLTLRRRLGGGIHHLQEPPQAALLRGVELSRRAES